MFRFRTLRPIAVGSIISGCLLSGLWGMARAAETNPSEYRAPIGKPAPTFELKDVAEGKTYGLAEYTCPMHPEVREDKPGKCPKCGMTLRVEKHKAVVILFIAARCPSSNAYNDRMVQLSKDYQDRDVLFLGINSNSTESAQEVAQHARDHQFPFPVLKDPDNKVADEYDAQVTPEVYVVDSEGILRYHGRIDDSQDPDGVKKQDLRAALDALLAGQEIAVKETAAFG